jgi:hypothetical protein
VYPPGSAVFARCAEFLVIFDTHRMGRTPMRGAIVITGGDRAVPSSYGQRSLRFSQPSSRSSVSSRPFLEREDLIVWFWIGPHEQYETRLASR